MYRTRDLFIELNRPIKDSNHSPRPVERGTVSNENTQKTGRVANTKRNILYGLFQVIVSQLMPFAVRTIIIYRFGADYLGLSSLFTSVLSVLSLMELGFGTAVVYSMFKPVSDNDTEQICKYLAFYRRIYAFIGTAILLVGLALMPFLRFLIKEQTLPGGLNLYLCYLVFLSDAVISYLLFGYMTSIPLAYQRRDILSKIKLGMSLPQCLVKLLLLLLSDNFYFYLFAIPVITVVHNLITAYVIRRRYPELKCQGELSADQKHDLSKKVSGLLINKITAVSRNSIDTLCISVFVGLTVTGMYSMYYYIMAAVISGSTLVLGSMAASVGNSIAAESREKNYNDMRLFDFTYMGVTGWATVCLLCLYQPFVSVWLGKDMMFGTPVMMAFCVYFYILKSGDIRWVYHEGAGLWYECRFYMIGEAIVNTVLNIVLCKVMGVLGILLATVVTVFTTNCFLCPRVLFKQYFMNGKMKEYLTDHLAYAVTMILTAAASWLICEALLPARIMEAGRVVGILSLFGRLAICSLLSLAVFWVIWRKSAMFKKVIKLVKKIVKA